MLALLAGLNLFLGMINLRPAAAVRRWRDRHDPLRGRPPRHRQAARHRPDPGGVDSAKLLPVTYVMAALILVMTILLIYADIVAPVSLT